MSDELEERVRQIGEQIADLTESAKESRKSSKISLLQIPNLPNDRVPMGEDASANVVVRVGARSRNYKSRCSIMSISATN